MRMFAALRPCLKRPVFLEFIGNFPLAPPSPLYMPLRVFCLPIAYPEMVEAKSNRGDRSERGLAMTANTTTGRLTKTVIEAAQPDPDPKKRRFLWDGKKTGFGLRVTSNGVKTFVAGYRAPDRRWRLVTIGRFPAVSVEVARIEADRILAAVVHGKDPAKEKQLARNSLRFGDVADEFIKHVEVYRKPKTATDYKSILKQHLRPEFGHKRIDSITKSDVARFHSRLGKEARYQANRCRAVLSAIYAYARQHGYVDDGVNPCLGVPKHKEKARQRYLSPEEIARLTQALADVEDQRTAPQAAIDAVRLLLATGLRRGEILNLRWDDVNLDGRVLHLRDSKTGERFVPINGLAVAIFGAIRRRPDCPFVCPGPTGDKPMGQFDKSWERICKTAKIENLRVHDLRHSFGAIAAGAHLGLNVIGALFGHTQAQTTQRYAHVVHDAQRAATETVGNILETYMAQRPSADVIEMTPPAAADAQNKATVERAG